MEFIDALQQGLNAARGMSGHDRGTDYEEDDPVTQAIAKTGCLELHYAVQECMAEKQDWRQCKTAVQDFKRCMDAHNATLRTSETKPPKR